MRARSTIRRLLSISALTSLARGWISRGNSPSSRSLSPPRILLQRALRAWSSGLQAEEDGQRIDAARPPRPENRQRDIEAAVEKSLISASSTSRLPATRKPRRMPLNRREPLRSPATSTRLPKESAVCVEALVAGCRKELSVLTLAIGNLPDPSDVEVSGGLLNSPIGSTIQYQPVCGCENLRSPSCGRPALQHRGVVRPKPN